jgi:uncharacterized RDD family membrane protein YckC
MAQPPDDRPPQPADAPRDPAPDEQPTVAWTPPEEAPIDTSPPPPSAPPPDGTPSSDPAPTSPIAPADAEGQSPLISWAPSGGTAAAATDAPAGASPGDEAAPVAGAAVGASVAGAPGAVVGWTAPGATLPPSPVEGYQTAGVGSRLVAWVLDGCIVILLTALILFVIASVAGGSILADPLTSSALTGIVLTGVSFLYFVGLWTAGGAATVGMRSMGMRIVAAPGGRPLQIGPAVIRWAALGYPLSLVSVIPAVSEVASYALVGWLIVLLITTAISDTNQGLHDRWAGSTIIRRIGAGMGCVAVGCLLMVVILVGLFILLPLAAISMFGPEFWDEFIREMERAR